VAVQEICPVKCGKCSQFFDKFVQLKWQVVSSAAKKIVATSMAGFGTQKIRVTTCKNSRCRTDWVEVSFAPTSLSPNNPFDPIAVMTQGGTDITIKGVNFIASTEPLQPFRKVTFGTNAVCNIKSVSSTQLVCTAPPGAGKSVSVFVTVHTVTLNSWFEYQQPTVQDIVGCNSSTFVKSVKNCYAGDIITLKGTSFGSEAVWPTNRKVTIGGQVCSDIVVVEAHTRVSCKVPSGFGADLAVRFEIDGRGNTDVKLSYFIPIVDKVEFVTAGDGSMTGNSLIVKDYNQAVNLRLTGSWENKFSATAYSVRVGSQSCKVDTATVNSTYLQCTLPCGNGKSLPIILVIETYQSAGAFMYSFQPPQLQNNTIRLDQNSSGSASVLGITTEGDVVHFDVLLGNSNKSDLGVFFGPHECSVLSITPKSGMIYTMSCRVAKRQRGKYNVTLMAGPQGTQYQYNLTGSDTYSYPQAPLILSVSGCPDTTTTSGTAKCPTKGWHMVDPRDPNTEILLTIKGTSFGRSDAFVLVGGRQCKFPTHNKDNPTTSLTCKLPAGSGLNQLVEVKQISNGSPLFSEAVPLVSYESPTLIRVEGCPSEGCARSGSPLITVVGENFGLSGAEVVVSGQQCNNPTHSYGKQHTHLLCNLPSGAGSNQSLFVIQKGGSVSTNRLSFDFTKCPEGTYNNGTACAVCLKGKYTDTLDADATFCLPCPAGKSGENADPGKCQPCATGKYASKGSDVCKTCVAGEESSDNLLCRKCTAGKYRNVDLIVCKDCEAGKFQDATGATACQSCPAGEFTPEGQTGQINCRRCSPGKAKLKANSCDQCPGGTFSSNDRKSCINCTKGTFSGDGATACQQCVNGTFANKEGMSSCIECSPGRFAQFRSSTTCSVCPSGKFSGSEGSPNCLECSQGKYSNTSGSTACSSCERGRYQNKANHSACDPCSPGKYSLFQGATSCKRCSSGRFTSKNGTKECQICLAGKFSNSSLDGVICQDCPLGTYSDPGENQCTNAPPRYFVNITGATEPTLCRNGTTTSEPGQTSCTVCDRGKISYNGNKCSPCASGLVPNNFSQPDSCVYCSPGSFPNSTTSTCEACPEGKYNSGFQGTACLNCPAGRFSESKNSTECYPCPAGRYGSKEGQSICQQCDAGKFSRVTASVSCNTCDPGSDSKKGASTCSPCLTGYYRTLVMSDCEPCRQGFYSDKNGSVACTECEAGRFQNKTGSSECNPCPPHKYQEYSGQSQCEVCGAGKYNSQAGQATCLNCKEGTSSTKGTCEDCLEGFYADAVASPSCKACPKGKYGKFKGASACLDCSAGKFSTEDNTTECTVCGSGTYQKSTGESSCEACPVGTFAKNSGSTECQKCQVGSYAGNTSMSACEPCKEGRYASIDGLSICTTCSVGFFGGFAGATECKPCPSGYYQNIEGKSSCDQCGRGKYSVEGQANCTACNKGKFQDQLAASSCKECSAGKISNSIAAISCTGCRGGLYSKEPGTTACLACEAGKTSDGVNAKECKYCPVGFVSLPGSFCVECPLESRSSSDRTRCICPPGRFFYEKNCQACPQGADCTEEGNYFESLRVKTGWWRPDASSLDFERCLLSRHCKGGAGSGECELNRGGPLCMVCNELTRSASKLSKCEKCPEVDTSVALTVLVCLGVVLLIVGGAWVVLKTGHHLEEQLEDEDRLREDWANEDDSDIGNVLFENPCTSDENDSTTAKIAMFERHQQKMAIIEQKNADQDLIYGKRGYLSQRARPNFMFKLKIMVAFLQVATNLTFVTEVPWPTAFADFISAFDIVNLSFVPWNTVACVGKFDYYRKLYVLTLGPICLAIVVIAFFIFPQHRQIRALNNRYNGAENAGEQISLKGKINTIKRRFRKVQKLALFGLFLIYPSISRQILMQFVCRYINEEWILYADFSMRCFDSRWFENVPYSIVMILIFPIGIPLVFFLMIKRRRKQHDLKDVRVLIQLGFLYDAFELQFWYWEPVDMFYKLTMTAMIGFFPGESQIQVALTVCVLYTIALLKCSPYLRNSDFTLHIFTQNAIFLFLLMGYTVNSKLARGKDYFDDSTDLVFSILLIFATVLTFLVFVVLSCLSVRRMLRVRSRKRAFLKAQAEQTGFQFDTASSDSKKADPSTAYQGL